MGGGLSSASFFLPMPKNHDHTQYEIFRYAAYLRGEHRITEEMRSHAVHWVPTLGMSNDALVKRIRDDGIDILVDLSGRTKGSQFRVSPRYVSFAQSGLCPAFAMKSHEIISKFKSLFADFSISDATFRNYEFS